MLKIKNLPPHHIRRMLSALLVLVFALSSFISLTLAWSSLSQSATNAIEGESRTEEFPARLIKLERDIDGNPTDIRLEGAEFLLFRITTPGDEGYPNPIQIGGRLVTDENGQINVNGLLPGEYFFLETNPPSGFTFDVGEHGERITRYYFTITGDDELTTVTAYNRRITGDLIVEKTVRNADNSTLTQEQLNQEFEFVVTFTNLPGNPVDIIVNGETETLSNTNYQFNFTLRHGQSAVFENIPVGVEYTVVELPTPGFSVSSNNHQGTITADEEPRIAEFTNTWLGEVGGLRITKDVVGIISDTEFEFTAVVGGVTHTFTLRNSEEWILNNLPIGTQFTVTEIPVDGYTATILQFTGEIAENGVTIHLPFINVWDEDLEDQYGSLRISKTVPGGSDTEFTFTVIIGGETHIFTLRDGQYKLFEDIPHGTPWSVEEHSEEGYIASILTANGIIAGDVETTVNFVNYTAPAPPEDVEITIKKIVDGDMPDPAQRFEFILEVYGQEPIEFDLAAGESAVFTIPAGVMYTITEVNIPGGFSLISVTDGHGTTRYGITAEFTNRFDGLWTIDVDGEKTWIHPDGIALPDSITIRLMNGDIVVAIAVVTPDSDGRWTFTFEDVPKYDSDGDEVMYTVIELPVDGWSASYDGFDVVNTYIGYRYTNISVHKVWNDGNSPYRPDSVQVQLYRDGTAYGEPVTLNTANAWSHKWTRLDIESEWTVDEINVPDGYTKSIAGNAEDGFIITNSKDRDIPPTGTVIIEGRKFWNHGTNTDIPSSITVIIFANGQRYKSFALTEDCHWRWSFELLKYDLNGNAIVYTVDEEYVRDYNKSISGFDITNTHISAGDSYYYGGTSDIPRTGDDSNVRLWLILMILSLIGLTVTFTVGIVYKRRYNYRHYY